MRGSIEHHRSAPPRATRQHHRSVSLEYDHGAAASRGFVVTGCANRAIRRILAGLTTPDGSRAWTLTGPFGTGKSSFALFLSHLFGHPTESFTRNARKELKNADSVLYGEVEKTLLGKQGLVPIIISGSRESFATAITRAIAVSLEASNARGAMRLARDIRQTLGDARHNPIKMLDKAIECLTLDDANAGVVIVVDELGKLLEYAASHPKQTDVFLLQQLAEHAARAKCPTVLIGILHQDFSGYANELNENDRREWEKVRGRFEDIIFEQSADDMLRLISEAMSIGRRPSMPPSKASSRFTSLCKIAWTHKLVPPGLNQSNGLSLLENCYPLHPSVTLLLGAIFKRFGQNERSAFSFLTSGEPHALPDFLSRSADDSLYCITSLYEYLIAVFGDSLLSSRDGKRWAEAFNVEAQHPDLNRDELRLLRTIAMLGIVGRWNGVPPTPAVIQFSMAPAIDNAGFDKAVKSLQAKSAIVYRRFNDTYSLWEGSDIDVESRIADTRSQIAADASTVHLLATHFSPRPLLARRHSYEKGTLRHFEVVFVNTTTSHEVVAKLDANDERIRADGFILVALPDATRASSTAEPLPKIYADRADIIVCVPNGANDLESLARELSAIERVQSLTTDLQHDATARRELAARREDVHGRIQQVVASLLVPNPSENLKTKWYRCGKAEPIATARALNEWLSSVCDELYCHSPRINNEIINRRELQSSAAAAQGNLIEGMIEKGHLEGLAIEGNPPEKSVYLSVLRALGLHSFRDGQWTFATDEQCVRPDIQKVCAEIRGFFDGAKDEAKGLDQLFSKLRLKPFGLRNGVVPIFVCAALIGNESNVAIYDGGAFVPQLTSAIFDQIIKTPSRFKIRRWHVTGLRFAVFEQLAKMLGRNPAGKQAMVKDLLDVVKPLMRFVRQLNDFSRQTRAFAPATLAVRGAIADASEPDALLFHDLPIACGFEPFDGSKKDRASDVERFLRALQTALAELQRGYDLLLENLKADLAVAFEVAPDGARLRGILEKRADAVRGVALNPDVKVFTARLADQTPDDSIWIEQVAAFLASKHPTIWHDDDRARFAVRLAQLADAFKGLESLVYSRSANPGLDSEHESIRIAVVGTKCAQTQQVVHLNQQEAIQVSELQLRIQKLYEPYAVNGSRKLAIAALAKAAQILFDVPAEASVTGKQRGQ